MKRIITFGEIMVRLNPEGYLRFVQAPRFEVSYAGGEANVAVSLCQYGHSAAFVSAVPSHEIGQCAVNALRQYGVDTTWIRRQGNRLGVYYVEKGASQRGSKVIYDRSGSSIATALRKDFDWEHILEEAHWFHFTGITPALGGDLPAICMDAVQAAKAKGLMVSCDLNYRSKLWTHTEASETMGRLLPYVDVLIANEEDAKDVFGIEAENTDIQGGKLNYAGYVKVAKELSERFGCKRVAITLRSSHSASDNEWAGMLFDQGTAYFSRRYAIHIVDRVGGGDSFGAGLIHGLICQMSSQQAIDFAAAASCLKHSIEKDFNLVNKDEVLALKNGNQSGRVQR